MVGRHEVELRPCVNFTFIGGRPSRGQVWGPFGRGVRWAGDRVGSRGCVQQGALRRYEPSVVGVIGGAGASGGTDLRSGW